MTLQENSRKKKSVPLSFVTTCGAGLEKIVATEITDHGGLEPQVSPGAVAWTGDLKSGYSLCLWSRFSSRLLLDIAHFEAPDTDTLYREVSKVDWDTHFDHETTFAVFCTLSNAEITHSRYAALRVKDAIVDQFRMRYEKRPNVNSHNPQIRINLHINGTRAALSLDLSGESLHRRGYRVDGGMAPLKETLAAAIVELSGFQSGLAEYPIVLDPMCGSGTLLIEAAMMYGDIAPGLQRTTFGFNAWNKHDEPLWQQLVSEAIEKEDKGLEKKWPRFIGYDCDAKVIAMARRNIDQAGLEEYISVHTGQLASLSAPEKKGLMVVNPPYGERLSEKTTVKYLYRCLGHILHEKFSKWQLGFFSSNPDLAEMLDVSWTDKYRLYNGPIKCRLLVGSPKDTLQAQEVQSRQLDKLTGLEKGQDFANRFYKNCKALFKWSNKNNIRCFRVYDGDIPEFNFAVDLYEKWVHVQEYKAPATVPQDQAKARFELGLDIIRQQLGLHRSLLFIKTRQRQKGKNQYQKRQGDPKLNEVEEQGCRFLVNFTDYLDTGLFLDHRITRAMIRDKAKQKSFLNLYGYTGTATVYAAQGAASSTTTVDLSEKYLSRAKANLALNGFSGDMHTFVALDCLEWLSQTDSTFDLIFVDPPTFSNSKHKRLIFDLQKDHEKLLRLSMKKLHKDGLLIFSNNFRKFKLANELEQDFKCIDISKSTIPRDFNNNQKIHRCWTMQHTSNY